MLGVVEQVHVGEILDLRGGGHVGLAGEHLAAILRRVHDQRALGVVPVGRLFVLRVSVRHDVFAVRVLVEVRREGVLAHPALEAGADFRRTLEERGLVVAGPGITSRAGSADVTREHELQELRAVGERGVEPVVDALADVDGGRTHRGDVPCQPHDQIFRRVGDVSHRVEVVILQVLFVHRPEGQRLDARSVRQGEFARPIQHGINALLRHRIAHVVAGDSDKGIGLGIPHHIIAKLLVLRLCETLKPEGGAVGGEL